MLRYYSDWVIWQFLLTFWIICFLGMNSVWYLSHFIWELFFFSDWRSRYLFPFTFLKPVYTLGLYLSSYLERLSLILLSKLGFHCYSPSLNPDLFLYSIYYNVWFWSQFKKENSFYLWCNFCSHPKRSTSAIKGFLFFNF